MQAYRDALMQIMDTGENMMDRTGTGTRSLFGLSMRFPHINRHFPLLTGKTTHWKSVLGELLWFCQGDTNIKSLNDQGIKIWDEWAEENGDLGPVYGAQWCRWSDPYYMNGGVGGEIDQMEVLVEGLRYDPGSRRHLVSAWNVSALPLMKLPPCHYSFQCSVRNGDRLDMVMNQRSADMFLGVPFNIASYATLNYMLCHLTGYTPGHLTINLGDAHIYHNHLDQTEKLLGRDWPDLPLLLIAEREQEAVQDFKFEDFYLRHYNPLEKISAPVAV